MNTTINTTINDQFEFVSMMMDDEDLSGEMLDKLLADEGAEQKWYEYHLIRDCMVGGRHSVGRDAACMKDSAFAAALAEISAEHQQRYATQTPPKMPVQASNHAFKSFAVAASVAAVAVSVWQFWPQLNPKQAVPATAETAPAVRQDNVVPVSTKPDAKIQKASEPLIEPVMPNSVKEAKPEQQTAVRVESTAASAPQSGVVQ